MGIFCALCTKNTCFQSWQRFSLNFRKSTNSTRIILSRSFCSKVRILLACLGAFQRKSISGLRLWGSRWTERADATSGSSSAHWDCNWTRKPSREGEAGFSRRPYTMHMCTVCLLVTCVSWMEDRAAGNICEIVPRRNCLAWPRICRDWQYGSCAMTCQNSVAALKWAVIFGSVTWLWESSLAALSSWPSR